MASSLLGAQASLASLFARLSPVAKLLAWMVALTCLSGAAELATASTGWNLSLLDKNGGAAVLMLLALVGLLAIVAYERRPLADFGLIIDRLWVHNALGGLVAGLFVYGAYITTCVVCGALTASTSGIHPLSVGEALLEVAFAIPPAVIQQVIFAGLLLGLLRTQTGRWGAVAISAIVFGLAVALGNSQGITSASGLGLAFGMTLLAGLLGVLRLASGSIVFPAGVLAGALAFRRVSSKLQLTELGNDQALIDWLAPFGDPRQAPAFWCFMALCIAIAAIVVIWRGEPRLATDAAAEASFKRLNPFSNLLTFIPLERWAVLLVQAKFRIDPIYVPRLIVTLIGSAIGTLLALPERWLAPLLVTHRVEDPVFVIGIHRSGTTHLHNLLALDPQFRAPRNYEVFNPLGFMTGWITTALMTPALMWRRPMDSVQMTPLSSQEEEFALTAMGSPSPYAAFCLPREHGRHWKYVHAESFTPGEAVRWRRDYLLFLRKITWWNRKRPLLKNPANTGRIAMLRQMFPHAKFIYLVRNPDAVYRSNLHFAKQGLVVFQLQEPSDENNYADEFLENYRRVSETAERDLANLPTGQGVRIRFEELDDSPIETIAAIYAQLDMEFTFAFQRRLDEYVKRNADYRKNRQTPLPADQARAVRAAMGPFYAAWGYDESTADRRAA